jgi:hypothetical protein
MSLLGLSASTKELWAAIHRSALLETGHALSLQQPRATVDPYLAVGVKYQRPARHTDTYFSFYSLCGC